MPEKLPSLCGEYEAGDRKKHRAPVIHLSLTLKVRPLHQAFGQTIGVWQGERKGYRYHVSILEPELNGPYFKKPVQRPIREVLEKLEAKQGLMNPSSMTSSLLGQT